MPTRCPICDADLPQNPLAPPLARCPRCNMALSTPDQPELPPPLPFGGALPTAALPGARNNAAPPPVWTAPSPQQAPQPPPNHATATPAHQDYGVRYAHDVGKKIRRQQLWNRLFLFGFLSIAAIAAAVIYFGISVAELFDKASSQTATTLAEAREELIGPPTRLGDTEDPGVLDTILSGGSDERVKGHYIERIEERDGKKIRVWVRREENPNAPPAPRDSAPTEDPAAASRPGAPDITFQSAEGGSVSLRALRGKVVVLNIYANWCAPCRHEIPDFARFQTQDTTRGDVALYGVLSQSGTNDKALQLSRKMGVNYPILWGSNDALRALGADAFPTTIVLDAQGRVAQRFRGGISYQQLQRAVADAR